MLSRTVSKILIVANLFVGVMDVVAFAYSGEVGMLAWAAIAFIVALILYKQLSWL